MDPPIKPDRVHESIGREVASESFKFAPETRRAQPRARHVRDLVEPRGAGASYKSVLVFLCLTLAAALDHTSFVCNLAQGPYSLPKAPEGEFTKILERKAQRAIFTSANRSPTREPRGVGSSFMVFY